MKYFRKPIEVEAVRYLSDEDSYNALVEMGTPLKEYSDYIALDFGNGSESEIFHGDWIVKESKYTGFLQFNEMEFAKRFASEEELAKEYRGY